MFEKEYYHPGKNFSAGGGENALTHPPQMAGGVGRKCKRNPPDGKPPDGKLAFFGRNIIETTNINDLWL